MFLSLMYLAFFSVLPSADNRGASETLVSVASSFVENLEPQIGLLDDLLVSSVALTLLPADPLEAEPVVMSIRRGRSCGKQPHTTAMLSSTHVQICGSIKTQVTSRSLISSETRKIRRVIDTAVTLCHAGQHARFHVTQPRKHTRCQAERCLIERSSGVAQDVVSRLPVRG